MVSYAHVVYVTFYFYSMFSLGPSSGTLVVFGCIEVHVKHIHRIYIGVYPHKDIGQEDNV
jgi:hypothetical protein